jgi:hypothetical protein
MVVKKTGKAAGFLIIFSLLISITSCSSMLHSYKTSQGATAASPMKDAKSKDGTAKISVPAAWKEETSLNAQAGIQMADRISEQYVMVITESKERLKNMSLDQHSTLTRGAMLKKLSSGVESKKALSTVNGHPALQYTLSGTVSGIKVTYLHTTVETEKNFHQILCWTLQDYYSKYEPVFEKISSSLKETSAGN